MPKAARKVATIRRVPSAGADMARETTASAWCRLPSVYLSKYWVKAQDMTLERSSRHGVALIATAILVGSLAGPPSAPATPDGVVAETAGATVESVQGAAEDVAPLPSAAASPTAPAALQPPAKLPPRVAPAPPPPPTGAGNETSPLDGASRHAENLGRTVTSAVDETTAKATSPRPESGSSGRLAGIGTGASDAPSATGAGSSTPPSIRAA